MVHSLLPKNAIYLDREVCEKYPTVSLGSDSNLINFREVQDLQPICFLCGDHNIIEKSKEEHFPYFLYRCGSFKHFFCKFCVHANRTCVDLEPIQKRCSEIELSMLYSIKFECIWGTCNKIFGTSTLKKHEIRCSKQPKRECPVDGCTWSGRLDEMKMQHFETHKNSLLLFRNEVTDLKVGKDFYLLILGKFVLVRYAIEELGEVFQHDFTLKLCKEVLSFAKPVGLVQINKITVEQIEEGDHSIRSIRGDVKLFVYFENIESHQQKRLLE